MKNSINHMYSIPRNRIGETLTNYEKNHILKFKDVIDLKKKNMPTRFHFFSFIEMNCQFIELIDYYYPRIGRSLGVSYFWLIILNLIPLLLIFFFSFILEPAFYIGVFTFMFVGLGMLYMAYVNIKALKYYELQGYYYLPARLNRQNKKIYLYLRDGTQIERHLDEVVICISQIKAVLDTKEYVISVFELDAEGKITSHSTLGKANYNKDKVDALWEFINVYWIYGPEPLMPYHIEEPDSLFDSEAYLSFCNNVQITEPLIADSWQIIRYEHFMNPLFMLTCIPYDLLHLAARRICLKNRVMPVWNDEIQKKNPVDMNDPYRVTAKDNFYIYGVWSMKPPK